MAKGLAFAWQRAGELAWSLPAREVDCTQDAGTGTEPSDLCEWVRSLPAGGESRTQAEKGREGGSGGETVHWSYALK